MVKKDVLNSLMDPKKVAILKTLIYTKEEMYLKEISEKSQVSIASTFRILQHFVKTGILERRIWKTSKVYKSKNNVQVNFLKELFHEEYDGLQEFVDLVSGFVNRIILHGTRKKNQANVLLIGENIDDGKVEEICKNIKEKGFDLSFLTLTKEQYEQMSKMGLYSTEKKDLM